MEYFHLIWQLPAIVAGTTMLAYLSPWKIQPRFMPLLMFIIGMIVLTCPPFVSLALGLTIPAAYLQNKLGIELHGHEPLNITLPKLPAKIRERFEKPLPIQPYAGKAYPNPAEEPEAGEHEDEPPEQEPGDTVTDVPKYVPPL